MNQVASTLLSLAMPDVEPSITAGGLDFTPAVTFTAIILIIGFAVVAAGWVIRRDV